MITFLPRRLFLLAAMAPSVARAQPAPLAVAASFSILADFVREIGSDAVAVSSLVPPDGDPHSFQPRPGDIRRVGAAAVVVENGLGLEGWLARIFAASGFRGVRITATSGIPARRLGNAPDPHMWQDPRLAMQMVRQIAAGLGRADPARAGAYTLRGEAYAEQIRALDAEIEGKWADIPPERRRVITTHDAFAYYGARYGISFLAAQGISTDSEPSPRALGALAGQIRREGIRTVFLENMTDPRLARALAREAGAVVGPKLYADSLSPPDGPAPTYLAMLRYNTDQLTGSGQ
jgi:zinc/manganese transport system substrate-binding protein